jgi:hypothetical protein
VPELHRLDLAYGARKMLTYHPHGKRVRWIWDRS